MSGGWLELVWLIFFLAAGAWSVSALLVPALLAAISRGAPDPLGRSRRLLLAAVFPWLVPATVVAGVVATAGSKAMGWIVDHCLHHGLGHPHLCFAHLPAIDLGLAHAGFVGVAATALLVSAARLAWRERSASREVSLLKKLTKSRRRLRIVPTGTPLALAGGVLQPVVLLSRGLLDRLSYRERRIVAAHEAAHLRHGDARRNLLYEALLLGHVPWIRRRMRADWLCALEEQADDVVARRFGAASVVEAFLHVARINLRQSPRFSVAGAGLLGRAHRLLDGDGSGAQRRRTFEIGYALVLTGVFAASLTGHHALETLLGLLAGR